MRRIKPKRLVQFIALALAFAGSVALSQLTVFTSVTAESGGAQTETYLTGVEVYGWSFLLALAPPIVIAALPFLVPMRYWQLTTIIATVLMLVFAAFTVIGIFYLPAALASIAAIFLNPTKVRPARNGA